MSPSPDDVQKHALASRATPSEVASDTTMEHAISVVLRVGVIVSGAVILLGLVLSLIPSMDKGSGVTIHELLDNGGSRVSVTPGSIFDGLKDFDPISVIQLGLLLLILTPIVRVAMTLMLFVKQADLIFVGITGIVLIVLLLGFSGIV
jgi:uncharacterized membrane protein